MAPANNADGGPMLIADEAQIASFADVLFRYADAGTFVSLRSFYENKDRVFRIRPHQIGGDTTTLILTATALAAECAKEPEPVVFCPPVATFTNAKKATEADIANGLCLSVECDHGPSSALEVLETLLGPATIVVASGGKWTDPETGEIQDKLHLHWRLNTPTRTPVEHQLLKKVRSLATNLAGGDVSNKPVVHPIRWPGSWHRKSNPRLTRIVRLSADHELDLRETIERLQDATARQQPTTAGAGVPEEASAAETSGEERETAELVSEILTGNDYHAPIVALAMRWLKGGMGDGHAVVALRGIMRAVPEDRRDLKDGILQPGRWRARHDDIPRAVSTAREKLGAPPAPDVRPDDQADLLNPATLDGIDPPAREWIVEGWLPVGTVTSLYGGAGFGKTLLAQQLQTAVTLAAPFLGLPTKQCRSVAFYSEDDDDELHRRQRGICWHYHARMSDLGVKQRANLSRFQG